jgi:regulation of enolase protein 1 (concanavalin A-like superfamily)
MFYAVCGNSQAKNVLLQQAPVGDFAIETKLSINPTINYQQAGLLVFRDTNTYFKIGPAYALELWGGQGVQAVLVTNGGIAARFGFHVDLSSPVYLRLTKLDDRYLGYYSPDRQTWTLIGQVQSSAITDPKVGIFALTSCTGNPPDIPADFDYFRVTNLISKTSIFTGQGFDKCEIPTLNQLQIWMTNSPYKVVNLYIGGSRRSCANTALTSSYVTQLSQQGWKFIPTWVGPQCLYGDIGDDLTTAYNQGVAEANAAITAAANLGLTLPDSSGTIIYYDIEAYTSQNPNCRVPAKSFIAGWTAQLHATGNLSGVYGSSCAANISDFADISDVPDAVWPAYYLLPYQYRPDASVWNVACLSDSLWSNSQRIRQYAGGHNETWGGISLTIDSNVIDGIVVDLGVSYRLYLPIINKR